MFKIFRNVGLVLLILSSFIYTEKLTSVVKEYDDIMIKIKESSNNYKINPIESVIKDNTIIPGLNGRIVDIDKSYKKMREYGKYNESLYVYKKLQTKNKLKDNKDKFIIKSLKPNKVSIILKEKDLNNINLNQKINLYLTNSYIKDNPEKIMKVSKNHIILTNDNRYLKSIIDKNNYYCYTENFDETILKNCYKNDDYTINPNIILKTNSILKLEQNIESGSIISCNKNNYLTVIKYLQNKGYEIVDIEELLNEN